MATYNAIMNILITPFEFLPPLLGLTVISLISGVLLLLLYKYTSPQKTIKKVKDRIKAGLLEIRIFKDDLGVVTKAIGGLFLKNIPAYLGCNLIPLIPLVIVVVPLLGQLDARYGKDPFRVGDRLVVEVGLAEGIDPVEDDVVLSIPEGLVCEAGPVRVPSRRLLQYRVRVEEKGLYDLKVTVNDQEFDKQLVADETRGKISSGRFNSSQFLDLIENAGESAWPSDAPLTGVLFKTQPRRSMVGIGGDAYPWLIIFCLVGLAFGLALKGVFKVNI